MIITIGLRNFCQTRSLRFEPRSEMKKVVGIVQLTAGNGRSVARGLRSLGVEPIQIEDENSLLQCTHIVLPGVASFGAVVDELHAKRLFSPIKKLYGGKVRILGLCAGMQIMGEESNESPRIRGLGWFDYKCVEITNCEGQRKFHTGWNSIEMNQGKNILSASMNFSYYFNHSYFVPATKNKFEQIGVTRYFESDLTSIFLQDNIVGIQFHPEKSQKAGISILRNFVDWF